MGEGNFRDDFVLNANLQVDVMFHQPHTGITWPTLLVVVTHNVLIVGVRVLREVPLNQISGLVSREPEEGTMDDGIFIGKVTELSQESLFLFF